MTIKFVCTCGKHLKARDEMAARRSVCPRCGSPVGIPSQKPTHSGTTAAPMTPVERLRHARDRKPIATPAPAPELPPPAPKVPKALDPRLVHLLSTLDVRQPELTGRDLEEKWYECLAYPLRAWRLCLMLALYLTAVSAAVTVIGPRIVAMSPSDFVAQIVIWVSWLALPVVIVGIPCSFLDCVLASAAAGEVYYIVFTGSPLTAVLRSGVKWLMCFLAGPIVFAAASFVYWLQCGDPGILDYAILTELGIVTVAYWFMALVSLTDRGRLRDLNPLAVVDMAHRLGWRALGVVLGSALLLLGHGWVLLIGVTEVHVEPVRGLAILTVGWLSALYWSTFFCRLLGVWCHRSRPEDPISPAS